MTAPTDIARVPTLAEGQAHYEQGRYAEALACFDALARQGDDAALFWLSTIYANGDGVAADRDAAFRACLQSAELGNLGAQTNLGVMLVEGRGCAADPGEGLRWLRRAADAGDTGAQFNVATLLSAGKYVDKDLETAAGYYERAARAGYHPAQARLGYAYRNGFGVGKDRRKAFFWLSLAARHGAGTAISMLEGLITEMSPDELHEAQQLVDKRFEIEGPEVSDVRFRVRTH